MSIPPLRHGFGLVELMIAMLIGLIVLAALAVVFIAQRQAFRNAASQALTQSADNVIAATLEPAIRSAGFMGCASVEATAPFFAIGITPINAVQGFRFNVAANTAVAIDTGAASGLPAASWIPQPPFIASLNPAPLNSDIVVLFGAQPGYAPVGVVAFNANQLTVSNGAALATTDSTLLAISDCNKSLVFQATAIAANTVRFPNAAGPTANPSLDDSGSYFAVGAQLIPVQQTAFYIAPGDGGQSALWQATGNGGGLTAAPIVPGVSAMQARYGIETNNGQNLQYLTADQVTDWNAVISIKLGFLIEGRTGSASFPTAPATGCAAAVSGASTSYTLFDTPLCLPADSRLRHTFYLTVNTRNLTL